MRSVSERLVATGKVTRVGAAQLVEMAALGLFCWLQDDAVA